MSPFVTTQPPQIATALLQAPQVAGVAAWSSLQPVYSTTQQPLGVFAPGHGQRQPSINVMAPDGSADCSGSRAAAPRASTSPYQPDGYCVHNRCCVPVCGIRAAGALVTAPPTGAYRRTRRRSWARRRLLRFRTRGSPRPLGRPARRMACSRPRPTPPCSVRTSSPEGDSEAAGAACPPGRSRPHRGRWTSSASRTCPGCSARFLPTGACRFPPYLTCF